MGSRRSNCYLNSAYNRNVDDYDDYIDSVSQRSFDVNSCRRLYDSETDAHCGVLDNDDSYYEDDRLSCYSNDDRLAAFDESQIDNRSYNLQQLQRYHKDVANGSNVERYVFDQEQRLTSTPKKLRSTPAHLKNPHRRQAIVRHHSFSALGHREFAAAAAAGAGFVKPDYRHTSVGTGCDLRRSYSSLSLRPATGGGGGFDRGTRYAMVPAPLSIDAGYSSETGGHHFRRARPNMNNKTASLQIQQMSSPPPPPLPATLSTSLPLAVHCVSPFQIRQKSNNFPVRNPFLRRPYAVDSNSSFSSSRPLVNNRQSSRNTAVISPIYSNNKNVDYTSCSIGGPADHSNCSSTKSTSWLQTRGQTLPLCTLRTSAGTLLFSGGLTCLLCIALMSQRGKSYELTLSLICGFVIFCLGLPCFRFEHWQWIPNRNYVSGYVILSLFSLLQLGALWMLNRYSDLRPEWVDVTKGALCGISILSLSMAFFGVCASCCCKYPPPDNRVTHGVQGFTV